MTEMYFLEAGLLATYQDQEDDADDAAENSGDDDEHADAGQLQVSPRDKLPSWDGENGENGEHHANGDEDVDEAAVSKSTTLRARIVVDEGSSDGAARLRVPGTYVRAIDRSR